MAEAILKSMGIPGVEVKSAGVYAQDGGDASENTRKVLTEEGINIDHQSSMLNESLINWTSCILTMTESHKAAVIHMFPQATGKIFTLKELAGTTGDQDISDPFGGPLEVYRKTFIEMKAAIADIINRI
ncbi:low molecular weight protein arginine phosphatase [Cytobacillus depressus]|uniref:Low molecular weight protein arginine phosphatase n=2 Tax=Cytobacillus depressus TaxID=1602942 RepID=A0A6L3V7Y2_9BACI|nr:low molecular weight protein arginine phosphatase [Cytobacillus depressus]